MQRSNIRRRVTNRNQEPLGKKLKRPSSGRRSSGPRRDDNGDIESSPVIQMREPDTIQAEENPSQEEGTAEPSVAYSESIRVMLSAAVESMKKEFQSHMRRTEEQLATLHGQVSELHDSLKRFNGDVHVTMAANNARTPVSLRKNSSAPKQVMRSVECSNPTLRTELDAVFHVQNISTVTMEAVCIFFRTASRGKENENFYSKLICIIMYGLRGNMAKSNLRKGLGLAHCNFRFFLVKKIVAYCEDLYGVNRNGGRPCTQTGSGNSEAATRHVPEWLRQGYINSKCMKYARQYAESTRNWSTSEELEGNDGVAMFLSSGLYSRVTEFLRKARDRSKCQFFEDIGFLLSPWTCCEWLEGSYNKPKIELKFPEECIMCPSNVPETRVGRSVQECAENKTTAAHFMRSRKECHLSVSYDVKVAECAGMKVKKDAELKDATMTRTVNIMEVAFNFLVAYVQGQTKEDFLGSSPMALQTTYSVALVFRHMIMEFVMTNEWSGENVEPSISTPVAENVEDSGSMAQIRLSDLIPGEYTRKNTLERVLRMTSQQFKNLMENDDSGIESYNSDRGEDTESFTVHGHNSVDDIDVCQIESL